MEKEFPGDCTIPAVFLVFESSPRKPIALQILHQPGKQSTKIDF
jgi:hypothetical protein